MQYGGESARAIAALAIMTRCVAVDPAVISSLDLDDERAVSDVLR